jgi:hypothetical protein
MPVADAVPRDSRWLAVPAAPTDAVQATNAPVLEGTVVNVVAAARAEQALTDVSATCANAWKPAVYLTNGAKRIVTGHGT